MGLRVVMVTGDNPLTAKAIADEAGVDDFIAQATPEAKLAYIRKEQAGGKLVAMMGDGTNDAPALAQADIGVAMNSGTQAAKEAGNMVDLDSDPTKLIEVVEIGKQLLMTRGALTTFSIANDLAKYFAVIPAMFVGFASLASLSRDRPDGPGHRRRPAVGDPLGRDFQRHHHPALDPDRLEGRHIPPGRRQRALAAQPAVLRPGGRHRTIHRNQADRYGHRPAAGWSVVGVELLVCRSLVRFISDSQEYSPMVTRIYLGSQGLCHHVRPLRRRLSGGGLGCGPISFSLAGEGSLIYAADGRTVVGSELMAQQFESDRYFHPRPSAVDYKADAAGGSNLGTNNPDLHKAIAERVECAQGHDR